MLAKKYEVSCRAKKEEKKYALTFDILLVVMVIKVNRNPKAGITTDTKVLHKTHIMMRKLAKVTYSGAENLQIKSFSTLIGYFCDWLLEIMVQKFCEKVPSKHRFAIGLTITRTKLMTFLLPQSISLLLMVQISFFCSFNFIIRSFWSVNCFERCEKFQTIKSSASSIY